MGKVPWKRPKQVAHKPAYEAPSESGPGEDMRLKLLSYNIKVGAQTSLAEVGSAVAALEPDVVALQEVGISWFWGDRGDGVKEISQAAKLPHTRFAPALAFATGAAFGVALLSRFPIKTHRLTYLPKQVDEPRVLLDTEVLLPKEKLLRVLTTHLSYKEDRVSQGRKVAEELKKDGPPAVLLGDLNAEPEEGLHRAIAPSFLDAFAVCGDGAGLTFSVEDPKWRIDYALCDPRLTIHSCRVPEVRASDHFPLLVEVEIP